MDAGSKPRRSCKSGAHRNTHTVRTTIQVIYLQIKFVLLNTQMFDFESNDYDNDALGLPFDLTLRTSTGNEVSHWENAGLFHSWQNTIP